MKDTHRESVKKRDRSAVNCSAGFPQQEEDRTSMSKMEDGDQSADRSRGPGRELGKTEGHAQGETVARGVASKAELWDKVGQRKQSQNVYN